MMHRATDILEGHNSGSGRVALEPGHIGTRTITRAVSLSSLEKSDTCHRLQAVLGYGSRQ